jgi:hypothetical protein
VELQAEFEQYKVRASPVLTCVCAVAAFPSRVGGPLWLADTVYFLALQGLLERVKKNMIESCKNTDESNQVCIYATGCSHLKLVAKD